MFLLMLGFVLFNSACAQNPPFTGKAYVQEERLVEQATVLLNNEGKVVPLQGLENTRVASIRFSSAFAIAFDSLLNKYTKITSFNGNEYLGQKRLIPWLWIPSFTTRLLSR
jgi:hypothetical protein